MHSAKTSLRALGGLTRRSLFTFQNQFPAPCSGECVCFTLPHDSRDRSPLPRGQLPTSDPLLLALAPGMVVPWTEDLAVTRCPELAVQFPAPDLALKAPVWAPGTAVGLGFFGAPVGGAGKFPGG